MKEDRIKEIDREIEVLRRERQELKGYTQLDVPNRKELIAPLIFGSAKQNVAERSLSIEKMAETVRKVLTPDGYLKSKAIKDMSATEHKAVSDCVRDCIEIIAQYSKKLHPNGIALGEYKEGDSLFRD